MLTWVKAFFAGFVAVLVFHQGMLGLLYALELVNATPFNLSPVPPLGVPAVLSAAFFGGLWALLLWALLRMLAGPRFWLLATLFGAVAPSLVALLVVFPLKGLEVSGMSWVIAALVNGAWGFGVALLMRLLTREAPGVTVR